MARSIHDTWGVWDRAERSDWADPEIPKGIVAEMRKNVSRQSAIRESERNRRQRGDLQPQPVHPDHIPITVEEGPPDTFHAATEEDLRALMHQLPPGSLDGLQAIRLHVDRSHEEELLPGVFSADAFGTYTRDTGVIDLHAFSCDVASLGPLAHYLKILLLQTFLHEVGHHFDLTFRMGRSRWDLKDTEKKEAWADQMMNELTRKVLMGFLCERYPREGEALLAWIEQRTGCSLSTIGELFLAPFFVPLAALDTHASRVTLARRLHRIGANEHAAKITERMFAERAEDPDALAVSACIALCEHRDYETVEVFCARAIAADPKHPAPREVLVRSYATQKNWARTRDACEDALSVITVGDALYGHYVLVTLMEAHLELGDHARAEAELERLRGWGTEHARRTADVHEAILSCRRERWDDALILASRLLAKPSYEPWSAELEDVRSRARAGIENSV